MKYQVIPIAYGCGITVILIVYFLSLSLAGLHIQPAFSFVNVLFMGAGMYLCIKHYKKHRAEEFKYQDGFGAGLLCGFTATVIYTAFFTLYVTELNPRFTDRFMPMWKFDWSANVGMLLFTVLLMGFATTMVLSLTFMQFFKNSWNTREGKKHTLSGNGTPPEKH
ncbi:DUF4199 domain-containing protein [Sinomicrobium soli]|uniref:DUF4199 domain-containing protein n=1 Tax=Sinomicrobium sp. N-1-3-6 TaxID=2219864 RepID=UPI000DCAF8DC|nr:DUF4199 domain-containing protein [Sinomicrobium sp. N-1-3-6]RAV28643.1 DUF4199 domain-containing protein [Sinomicrobium sp. N-1-3-6]